MRRAGGAGEFEAAGAQAFPGGLLRDVDPRCCRPATPAIESLLPIFELEKAIYELQYELDNRPDWAADPRGRDRRLLEST